MISIGSNQTFDAPEALAAFAPQLGIGLAEWEFLAPRTTDVEPLPARFELTVKQTHSGFDHLIQATIVDDEGRIYRQVYGDAFELPMFVGYFATAPSLRLLGDDEALLRLSLLHPGKPREDCRKRTPEEPAKMPPQTRTALDCPRERSPMRVRVELDGKAVIDESFALAGLAKDGASAAYRRQPIAAGPHRLRVQLNDDARRSDFTHERTAELDVKPGRIVLIDFGADKGACWSN